MFRFLSLFLSVILGCSFLFAADEAMPEETSDAGTKEEVEKLYDWNSMKDRLADRIGKKVYFYTVFHSVNYSTIPKRVRAKTPDAVYILARSSAQTYIALPKKTVIESLPQPFEDQTVIIRGTVHTVDLHDTVDRKNRKAIVIAGSSIEPYYKLEELEAAPDLSKYVDVKQDDIVFNLEKNLGKAVHVEVQMGEVTPLSGRFFRNMSVDESKWIYVKPSGRDQRIIYLFVPKSNMEGVDFCKGLQRGKTMHAYGRVTRVPIGWHVERPALAVDWVGPEKYSGETGGTKDNLDNLFPTAEDIRENSFTAPTGRALSVTYIDLGANPDRYAGKLVRFNLSLGPVSDLENPPFQYGEWREVKDRGNPLKDLRLVFNAADEALHKNIKACRGKMARIVGTVFVAKNGEKMFIITEASSL